MTKDNLIHVLWKEVISQKWHEIISKTEEIKISNYKGQETNFKCQVQDKENYFKLSKNK